MFREVGKIYVRAIRIIFRHPQFLFLSVVSTLVTWLNSFLASQMRTPNLLGLRCVYSWISLFVILVVLVGVPMFFIFMTYRSDTGIDVKIIYFEARKYFWKYIGQFFAGILVSLAYSLPVFCLAAFSVFVDDAVFAMVILSFWFLVFGYLNFGSITLGQRILLDGGKEIFQNSMQGLRVLNGNFSFFFPLYVINFFISMAFFVAPYALGSAITGVNLFSTPITPFPLFMKNALSALQTPYVTALSTITGILLAPLYAIIPTLAYLHVRSNDLSAYARRQQAPTEN